jgi:hypothetical protein
MSVVTLKYTRSKPKAAAHIRYITHRRGSETGETITRALFTDNGPTDKQAFYQALEAAGKGTIFFKFMISPDPRREDTLKDLDLQQITRTTIRKLERKLGRRLSFIATVHNDHTPHRHVHGIFLSRGRLSRTAFKELAKTARFAAEALLERRARDLTRASLRHQARLIVRPLLPPARQGRQRQGATYPAGLLRLRLWRVYRHLPFQDLLPLCQTKLKRTQEARLQLGGGR